MANVDAPLDARATAAVSAETLLPSVGHRPEITGFDARNEGLADTTQGDARLWYSETSTLSPGHSLRVDKVSRMDRDGDPYLKWECQWFRVDAANNENLVQGTPLDKCVYGLTKNDVGYRIKSLVTVKSDVAAAKHAIVPSESLATELISKNTVSTFKASRACFPGQFPSYCHNGYGVVGDVHNKYTFEGGGFVLEHIDGIGPYTYTSDNPAVAEVLNKGDVGHVIFKGKGTVNIKVTDSTGRYYHAEQVVAEIVKQISTQKVTYDEAEQLCRAQGLKLPDLAMIKYISTVIPEGKRVITDSYASSSLKAVAQTHHWTTTQASPGHYNAASLDTRDTSQAYGRNEKLNFVCY